MFSRIECSRCACKKLKIIVPRKLVRIKGSRILSLLTSWQKIFTRVNITYSPYERYYMANNIVKKILRERNFLQNF